MYNTNTCFKMQEIGGKPFVIARNHPCKQQRENEYKSRGNELFYERLIFRI